MSQETPVKEDRRRGKKGQRPLYFVCAALKKDNLIAESIQIADKDAAIASFKEKNKIVPTYIEGPFYMFKGDKSASSADPKFTVSLKAKEIVTSGNRWEGVLKGWKVIGTGLKAVREFANDELVLLIIDEPVEKGAKKIRFGSSQKIVRRSELEDAKSIS